MGFESFLTKIKIFFRFDRRFDYVKAGRWMVYYAFIGLIAGFGAIIFQFLCEIGSAVLLDGVAGYRPPLPTGELTLWTPSDIPLRKWVLLFLPAVGGLVAGWIVYTFAPEAEGHGTDSVIDCYHNKKGVIHTRVPFVKTIASAITLSTGGSAGKEGPISQIGAGFGSFLANSLNFSDRQRRIMMAAGMAAGIGSIFRTPLAGAIFAAEVMYRDPEIEAEVLLPAGIASVVAYCMYCLVFGWGSLFSAPDFFFQNPAELGPYLALAVILIGIAILYVEFFQRTTDFFKKLTIKPHFKPAIGGLLTGTVGFFAPQTLAVGYGFVQQALFNELTIGFLLILVLGKILTTSFSIGSGGSGGVFGPSVVLGGATGGAVGKAFAHLTPGLIAQPGAFVIVGMAGFFTAVSNTPIATIIFISEMTSSHHLLLPCLMVCVICHLFSRPWTLYTSQVRSRIDSPAHEGTFFKDVLQKIQVKDLERDIFQVKTIPEEMLFSEFKKFLPTTKQHYFPTVDPQGNLTGIFSSTDFRPQLFTPDVGDLLVMKDIANSNIITTTPSEDLNEVLQKFTLKNIDSLPVVSDENPRQLFGMLNRRTVISYYNRIVAQRKLEQAEEASDDFEV